MVRLVKPRVVTCPALPIWAAWLRLLNVVFEICRFKSVEFTNNPVPEFDTPESDRQLIVTFVDATVTVAKLVFAAVIVVLADESPWMFRTLLTFRLLTYEPFLT